MPGEYGDIIWTRRDPKTWELMNVATVAPPPAEQAPTEQPPPAAGAVDPQAEFEIMKRMMEVEGRGVSRAEQAAQASPQQKREWRKQLRMFDQYLRKGGEDPAQGVQELIDSGALYYDEDGAWTPVQLRGKQREALVSAVDQWADKTGVWSEQGFDPTAMDRYKELMEARQLPHEEYKQRVLEIQGLAAPAGERASEADRIRAMTGRGLGGY